MQQQRLVDLKLLLIGNTAVGKSSLLLRFSDSRRFRQNEISATIGIDFKVSSVWVEDLFLYLAHTQVCKMDVRGKNVQLRIWVRRRRGGALKLVLMFSDTGHGRF